MDVILLVVLLCLSAFFSSAETALTGVNRIRVETLAAGDGPDRKRAKRLLKILDKKQKMITAILIGNNLVNIAASAIATGLAIDAFGSRGVGIATGILTLLVLVFGEVVPKTLASHAATAHSLRVSWIIGAMMFVLTPVILILDGAVLLAKTLFRVKASEEEGMTGDEIKTVVNLSHEKGSIEEDEKEYIVNVFDFSDSQVKEVMTPRIDMTFIKSDTDFDSFMEVVRENMYTRYPVCDPEDPDTVVGIVNIKDILLYDRTKEFNLSEYVREPFLTFETKNTAELFDEMRLSSISMAVVLDEYGALAGIVTLEDLLEELVGEIRDEFDTNEVDDLVELSPREFDVSGGANLDDVCDKLPLGFSSDDYDTIGGYLTGLFDHFPKAGETFITEEGISLRVTAATKSRVERIRIRFPMVVAEFKASLEE